MAANQLHKTTIRFQEYSVKETLEIRDFPRYLSNRHPSATFSSRILSAPIKMSTGDVFEVDLSYDDDDDKYRGNIYCDISHSHKAKANEDPQTHFSYTIKVQDLPPEYARSGTLLFNLNEVGGLGSETFKDNTLTLIVEITLFVPTHDDKYESYKCPDIKTLLQWAANDQDLADFELMTGTSIFRCHKMFLAMHSDVFRMLFHNDPQKKSADLRDFDSSDVEKALEFIYMNELKDQSDYNSASLLTLADKWNIVGLRKNCEKVIASKICFQNAFATLSLAKRIDAPFLLAEATAFVTQNLSSLASVDDADNLKKFFGAN